MTGNRHYFKWNINELIALQREYELLELSIQEIAERHKRNVRAILCRLQQEEFIRDWPEAKGFDSYIKSASEFNFYGELGVSNNNDDNSEFNSETSSIDSVDSLDSLASNNNLPHYRLDFIDFKKETFDFLSSIRNFFKKISNVVSYKI
jgi:hypothetical protein